MTAPTTQSSLARPFAFAALLLVSTGAREATAAPPWVERDLTLPAGNVAFDLGAGLGFPGARSKGNAWVYCCGQFGPDDAAAFGINTELAVGITSRIELGVRTGLRFGDAPERASEPDEYGRLFDRQTFDAGGGHVANPEVRVRGALVRGDVVELGLEGRVVLPFEPGTGAGFMFGVPLAFHFGDRVRLDTGAFVPVVFDPNGGPVHSAASLPLDVWIQASRRFWVGPMTGMVFDDGGAHVSLGLGLGYQISSAIDFKAMFLFPDLTDDSQRFGIGAGVQIRIE